MASESKILTVSYGTFSCTLEGFDDPFNTMKAIAEYFRDLAAEDRYFGAEPPQPDAAMLHRIAEREVSRLVDSRMRDNSVVLRPQDQEAAPAAIRRVSTQPRPTREAADLAAKAATALGEAAAEPTLQDLIPTGVAAKLARIRQAVNPSTLAPGYVPGAAEATAPAEPSADAAEPPARLVADLAIEPPVSEDIAASSDEAVDVVADAARSETDDAETLQSDAAVSETAPPEADLPEADLPEADLPETATSDDESLPAETEVLSRLGALVSDPEPVNIWDMDEEEPAAPIATDAAADADAAPMAEDVPQEPVEALVETWLSNVDVAPETAELDTADLSSEASHLPAEAADLLPEAAEPALTLDEALLQDPLPEAAADEPLSLADVAVADPLPEAAPEAAPEAETAEAEAPVEAEAPAPAAKSKTKRVNSRVVRIHPEEDAPATRDASATRILDGNDDDFARLLRQADDVMSDSENRRRLDSIAHLKAAVAATEADRAAGTEKKPGTKEDRYRDDLAQSVQPEPAPAPAPEPQVKPRRKTISVRPQEPRPGTIRPGMISPPPLVLVSEQRIDRVAPPAPAPAPAPEPKPMVALRTGRLTGAIGIGAAAKPAMPVQKLVLEQRSAPSDQDEDEDLVDELSAEDEVGLARFAEQMGVKSMVDMLEAAAAYATCIENRAQFTRPQLMRRLLASAGGKTVSREEGLRSFGTLLRTGRIEKVSRGHYILADQSPYLAEARRMA
ncbi:hypothetical protein [Tabrizicola aquatica]|uniref:hypothetical protein n=1 Tax=Tabrizicola aquatica TaxID=909926 RepID=UPI000CD038A9|nr:hypothetical protein [Tabrizicola aquatica]